MFPFHWNITIWKLTLLHLCITIWSFIYHLWQHQDGISSVTDSLPRSLSFSFIWPIGFQGTNSWTHSSRRCQPMHPLCYWFNELFCKNETLTQHLCHYCAILYLNRPLSKAIFGRKYDESQQLTRQNHFINDRVSQSFWVEIYTCKLSYDFIHNIIPKDMN